MTDHQTNVYQTYLPKYWFLSLFIGIVVLLGLYASSFINYLLYHSLTELFTIAVAICIFFLTWNARNYLENNYLKLLGFGYVFIAFIDLFHTLAYKGMNIFHIYGITNFQIRLRIVVRYLKSITLLTSSLFISRRNNSMHASRMKAYRFAPQIDNALKHNTPPTPEAEAGAIAPWACPVEFYYRAEIKCPYNYSSQKKM